MSRNPQGKQTMLDAVSLLTATFTAATTDIITSASHGLVTGDKVELTTSGTLPAGLALATLYYVIKIDANTFKLSTTKPIDGNGQVVDVTDTGTGTHTWTVSDVGETIMVHNSRHKQIILSTDDLTSGKSITFKIMGSNADEAPDFHKAKSTTNEHDYIQAVDLEDGSAVDGDTGITISDTDDLRKLAINDDSLRWVCVEISQSSPTDTSASAFLSQVNDSY